jgi:cytochrome P450
MWRYVEDFVARRHAEPVDDLTSDLVRLSRDKPDQLDVFDIVNIVYSMALAGHETTTNTIGSGVLALLRNRDQWQRLVDDPSLIPNAVEEILGMTGRSNLPVARSTAIGHIDIPAGSADPKCASVGATIRRTSVRRRRLPLDGQAIAWRSGRAPFCLGAPLGRQ